ncbi:leucine-rich repeat-containing protein 70-like [Topomyia yanbarensis]|uniref:leucine-rich repeat-containing protein 70-like n=1 Tax=Topomyia yanbarensis TaxID=2498891 RepID=UPI00273A8A90|nr:leucine-rich repeat-containing protein 70-like [Topomyia yanbarensis]
MKILSSGVFVLVICTGLVLAVEEDQSKKNTTNSTADDNKPAKDVPQDDSNKKQPNALCNPCNCDAPQKTFNCSSAKLYKLFNMSDWASLNESGIATEIMLLDHNGLTEVSQFPVFDVKVLDLSHNNISVIVKKAFFNLNNLEVLDLSNNMLTSKSLVPDIFEGSYNPDEYLPMEKLKVLRLGYNQLHSLDQDLFEHLPNLEELSLVNNVFKVIDQLSETAIASVKTLRSLDLSYMELNDIPVYIFNAPQGLQYLNLTGNLLTTIPQALDYATNLKWLSLDENPIDNLQGDHVFPSLKFLEYLSLSYITPLKIIGRGAFSKLEALNEIHICNNPEFTYFHSDAFVREDPDDPARKDWPRVKKLYLHNNNLSSLDSQMLARWDDMEVVDIRVNPWNCECHNQWIVETLLPLIEKTTPNILNNVVCATPKQMAGLSMVELEHKHSQMRCVDKYGNNPQNDGALLIGLLIGVLVGIPLTAAVILIYRRGCFGLVHRGPADFSRAFYSRATNDDF